MVDVQPCKPGLHLLHFRNAFEIKYIKKRAFFMILK